MSTEQNERLAVLEEKLEALVKKNDLTLAQLEEIKTSITKYKGFIGGVVFIVSALWYVLATFKEWAITHLR